MAIIGTDIDKAARLLEAGGLVAIPTETVYGLAANALQVAAVTRIFAAKQRPTFDPLIVHVASADRLPEYVREIPPDAALLAEKFWPGPLTLLLPRKSSIPDLVTAGMADAGFRIPAHPMTLELLKSISFPLAAPSANPFGYISPTTAGHVAEQLGDQVDYILDGGPCQVGVESTIVAFRPDPVILRPGGISLEELQAVLHQIPGMMRSTSNPLAPGMLTSHYAPRKPVILGNLDELVQTYSLEKSAVLSFAKDYSAPFQIVLSPAQSLAEAAQRLFAAMRVLDQMPVDQILAELVPQEGLGIAINDRLTRAAGRG